MEINKESSVSTKIKEAGRHSIVYGLGSVIQSFIGFILLPILTKSLTKNDFGIYSLILMASSIASAIFYLGMTSALPRSYYDCASERDRKAIFTTAFIILTCGAILQAVTGYIFGEKLAKILTGSEDQAAAVTLAYLGGAIAIINQYFFSYLRLLRKSITSVVFSLISLTTGIGATLFLIELQPGSISAPFEAMAYSQALILCVFIIIYGKKAFCFEIRWSETSKLIYFGVAIVVANFGQMVMDWSDRLIISNYLTLADVGTYSAAVRVGGIINIIFILPFSQIWSPMIMEYRQHKNIDNFFTYAFSYYFIIGGAIVVAGALAAPELLQALIKSGVDHTVILVFILILIGNLLYGSINIVAAGLFYQRAVFKISYVYYGIAALKTISNIVLVPIFGIMAAAVNFVAAYIITPYLLYALSRQYFKIKIRWAAIIWVAIISLTSIVVSILLMKSHGIEWQVRLVIFIFTEFLIYTICLSKKEKSIINKFFRNFRVNI